MLQWLYMYVANVYFQCFICFLDICCKCVYLDVAYVSCICCKCFIWMLCIFAIVFKCFQVFLTHVLCLQWFLSVFSCF
jgi:hypothetical protein